jgi:hypothetical protein
LVRSQRVRRGSKHYGRESEVSSKKVRFHRFLRIMALGVWNNGKKSALTGWRN